MKTLLMIKPDIVEQRLYGEILAHVLRNRFKVTALKMLTMDRPMAERLYAVHSKRDFFDSLVAYITGGPVVAIEIEGDDVVTKIRNFIGVTDPAKSEPGTIRYMYGSTIQNNAVHASDSPESAKKELAIVFGGS